MFAFGIMTLDGEQKEQNDLIKEDQPQVIGTPTCANGQAGQDLLSRYHRVVNQRASTQLYTAGVGYRMSNNFSLGFGMNYIAVDELAQVYQDVSQSETCNNSHTQRALNVREALSAMALQPVFGLQYVMGDLAVGLAAKVGGSYMSQEYEVTTEGLTVQLTNSDHTSLEAANGGAIATRSSVALQRTLQEVESTKPMGSKYPDEIRAGIAWFGSTRLLVTADVVAYTGAKGEQDGTYGKADTSATDRNRYYYERNSVLNMAAGLEYYVVPAVPVRVGVFTNNDARSDVDKKYAGQPDHVDYSGMSLFASWVQPNSQIGAGIVLQNGTGSAQKLGNAVIQDVEATSSTFAFSATHSF